MKHGVLEKEELDVILNPYEMIHPRLQVRIHCREHKIQQVFESTLGFVKKYKIEISC